MTKMLELFEAARRVSVPLLAIRTADQTAAIAEIRAAAAEPMPLVQWDASRGITPVGVGTKAVDKLGAEALAKFGKPDETVQFETAMRAAMNLPAGAVLFVHNANRQLHAQEPGMVAPNVQALANLRDAFKMNFRMAVLLGLDFKAPQEMDQDIVVIDHALPGPEELRVIVKELVDSVDDKGFKKPDAAATDKAVDAISGLSVFAAEQVVSMSFVATGLDLAALWERKRVAIEATRGLKVYRGTEAFKDLVGLSAIKSHLQRRLRARTPVGCVVWIDEIDKALANVESDTSGVRMDQLRVLLTEMEDNEWQGMVAVGVSGGGKSLIAKAFGNEAQVPTIKVDLGDTESKYVGESEANMRQLMAIVKAVGRGHAYLIATSNNASVMRPELQRRFTDGMWMFDLLTADERAAAWKAYMTKYGLPKQALPDDDGWTGAEIRNACRYAWDCDCTLVEAAQFIVPMARSRGDEIENLRKFAHGRLLDASHPGAYQYRAAPMAKQVRAIVLPPQGKETVN